MLDRLNKTQVGDMALDSNAVALAVDWLEKNYNSEVPFPVLIDALKFSKNGRSLARNEVAEIIKVWSSTV